jgi:hypothetical protein
MIRQLGLSRPFCLFVLGNLFGRHGFGCSGLDVLNGGSFSLNDFGLNDFGLDDFGLNDFGLDDFGLDDFGLDDFGLNDFGLDDFGFDVLNGGSFSHDD